MLYIRWMGGFRRCGNLHDSLQFELNRYASDEVAVEPIERDGQQVNAKVGLLVDKTAVVKHFAGDCWSEYDHHGQRLYKTRNPRAAATRHREAWASPVYVGIVVASGVYRDAGEGFQNLPRKIRGTIRWYADMYNLPVYHLGQNGKLEVVKF
ncbi:MAG: hypothetical protein GX335_09705 [Firmicutes bacterium]|nr:hypothetical protein [Bacillota bacterium]